jgi:ribosome-binding protein aMBF1 (putative translation factor)
MLPNQDIRDAIKRQGICTWELAEKIGVHETTLYRYLRKELPEQEKQKYYALIFEIAKSKRKGE